MKPENGENEITVDVLKTLYTAECRVVANRIAEFARECGIVGQLPEERQTMDNISKAVEKQKPRKVLRKVLPKTGNVKGTDSCKCPECRAYVHAEYNYCPFCGQALDWSGVI